MDAIKHKMAGFLGSRPSNPTCKQCTSVLKTRRRDAEYSKDITYLIPYLIREKLCLLCKLILQLLPELVVSQSAVEPHVSNPQKCQLKREGNGDLQVYFDGRPRGVLTAIHDDKSRFATPETGDITHEIDSGLICQWINECETRHFKAKDEGSQRLSEPIDITLVDVIDKRLIRASSRIKFVALSYVWGSIPLFVATMSNRLELETIGGLVAFLEQIPLLILDAMAFVQSIGQRYLWVDSLCIEQDNPAQKHNQIAHMDIIYGQAFFTIVALSAKDASSSLPGVRSGTRYVKEVSDIILGQRWTTRKAHFSVAFQDAIYETRGWTMQERLFSKRCLYLTEYAAYWSCCQSIVWSDNDSSSRYELCLALQATGNFSHALNTFRRPQLSIQTAWETYRTLLMEYTQRRLTYSTDTLYAFAGISAALQEKLATTFTSGIPARFLDIGLFWTPASLYLPMQRNENFSSWSWSGWIGQVRMCGSPTENGFNTLLPFSRGALDFMIENLYTYRQASQCPIYLQSVSIQNSTVVYEKETDELTWSWDILCFSAFSAKISSFEVDLRCQYPTLLDERRRKCGVLYAMTRSPIFANQLGSSNEIILLSKIRHSRERFGVENMYTSDIEAFFSKMISQDSTHDIHVCDWQAYSYERNLVNVMLITQKGEFAERLCLGCIHEDAWNASSPQKKKIILR